MTPITEYERRQIRQALKRKSGRPKSRRLNQLGTSKERGCSVEEGRYERELVAAALSELTRAKAIAAREKG